MKTPIPHWVWSLPMVLLIPGGFGTSVLLASRYPERHKWGLNGLIFVGVYVLAILLKYTYPMYGLLGVIGSILTTGFWLGGLILIGKIFGFCNPKPVVMRWETPLNHWLWLVLMMLVSVFPINNGVGSGIGFSALLASRYQQRRKDGWVTMAIYGSGCSAEFLFAHGNDPLGGLLLTLIAVGCGYFGVVILIGMVCRPLVAWLCAMPDKQPEVTQ